MTLRSFRLREGTYDAVILASVFEHNEYALPEMLCPGTTVIDVGAHIGAFSAAAIDRGADRVIAIEADPTNAMLARLNLAPELRAGKVQLIEGAAWGSDERQGLFIGGFPPGDGSINTGGASVSPGVVGRAVRSFTLDRLIERAAGARSILVKLDCEGAEWSILLGSTMLGRVDLIVGEYHPATDGSLPDGLQASPALLEAHLVSCGFDVTIPHPDEAMGLFRAERPGRSQTVDRRADDQVIGTDR